MGFLKKLKKAAKKATGAVSSGAKSVQKYANNAAEEMHLHSIKQSFDVKTLVSDPRQFAEDAFGSVKEDVGFAGKFFQNFYSGRWGEIAREGSGDTIAALKGKSSEKLSKKEQALVAEAETAGTAASAYYRGDYEGFAKALEQSQIGLVSDSARGALAALEEAGVAQEAYAAYQRGDYEAMNRALQKSQVKLVAGAAKRTEGAATYASEGRRLSSAYDAGGADAAIAAGKESKVGLISDLSGYAEKGKAAYGTASAAYDQSRELDSGGLLDMAAKEGTKLASDGAYRKHVIASADKALSKGVQMYSDRKAKHPMKQETDRSVAKLTVGISSNSGTRPLGAGGGGLGGIVQAILGIFGL